MTEKRTGKDRRRVERPYERQRREFDDCLDPTIIELQRKVREAKPHEPKPGDADYMTDEQIARIKWEREAEELGIVCAWCPDFKPRDPEHKGKSHGMCPACRKRFETI